MIGPDGQPMGAVPASALAAARPAGRGRRRRRGRRARDHRPGGAAGQGDADRQHDPPAARGGEGGAARRGQPQPAQGDPPGLDQGARGRASPPSWSRSSSGSRCRSPRTPRRPRASCGSPRPSWSAGSRASSTASRPRSTPSRWRPAPSSSRSARRCRRAPACRGGPAGQATQPRTAGCPAAGRVRAGCTSRTGQPRAERGAQPDDDQAEQADDHQRRARGGEPGEAVAARASSTLGERRRLSAAGGGGAERVPAPSTLLRPCGPGSPGARRCRRSVGASSGAVRRLTKKSSADGRSELGRASHAGAVRRACTSTSRLARRRPCRPAPPSTSCGRRRCVPSPGRGRVDGSTHSAA